MMVNKDDLTTMKPGHARALLEQAAQIQPRDANSEEDSAELRTIHSDYINDMAHASTHLTPRTPPASKEDKALRTYGHSSSEERKSVRLHKKDEARPP
jgi:hypothetical protein